jgi:hypothetical protein
MTSSDKKSSSSKPGLTRKQTPQYPSKSSSERRSHREDRDRDDDRRDSGECFAQFWYVQAVFCHFSTSGTLWGKARQKNEGKLGKGLAFFVHHSCRMESDRGVYHEDLEDLHEGFIGRGVEVIFVMFEYLLT